MASSAMYNGFKISIDKFLEENLPGITFVTDPSKLPETDPSEWVSVIHGESDLVSTVKRANISFHCLAKDDDGGFRRSQLIDSLIGVFEDPSEIDNVKRIPLYVVENSVLVQKSTIMASDTFVDGEYALTIDVTGQSIRFEFFWS